MKTIYLTKGLPASGKTYWAKQKQGEDSNMVRINKDDLRAMLHNSVWSKGREQFVLEVRDMLIEKALKEGHNVIVDDTNFHPKHEVAIKNIAKQYDAKVEVIMFDTPFEVCLERDKVRPNSVGEAVIRDMYERYVNNQVLDKTPLERLWVISDTHFNHEMLVREKIRPEDYNEQIIKNWNELVQDGDTVIHLGDVIFGDKNKLSEILGQLKGIKVLVRGNHDYKPNSWFIEQGFNHCVDQIKYGKILFTHEPVLVPENIDLNIHGHLHDNTHRAEEVKDILSKKHRLIALEVTGYKPIKLTELI